MKRENSLQTDRAGDVTLLKRYWNEASILVKILTAYSAQKAVFFENQLSSFLVLTYIKYVGYKTGAPNVNFRKISVRKTIWDLEFSEHLL